RANSRRWPTSELAEEALQALVEAELGRWAEGTAPEAGGRRPRWFELFGSAPDISDIRPEDDTPPDEGPPHTPTDHPPTTPGDAPGPFFPSSSPNGSCGETSPSGESRLSEMSGAHSENAVGEAEESAERMSDASVGRPLGSAATASPPYMLVQDAADLP